MAVPKILYVKSGWMPPALRFALLACRPWSVPASLVPTALTAGLVFDRVPSLANVLLPIVGAICLHMFGNLINTWCVVHFVSLHSRLWGGEV